MNRLEVIKLLEKHIPHESPRSHYYSFHVHFAKAPGWRHPFVEILSSVLAEIDEVSPGYAQQMVKKLASYKGMGDDNYEQLIQVLAEIHVLHKIVTIADTVEGKRVFAYEPQQGSKKKTEKNPEARSLTKGISYCAEVKSPRLLQHERARQKGVQLTTRFPYEIPIEQGLAVASPRDNPIKQALESAQGKFEKYVKHYPEDDFRILFIVWDDFIYEPITALLHKIAGLFTPNTFNVDDNHQPVTYPMVDGVVIVRQLHQFQLFLADKPCVDGVEHPFQFDNRLPNAFIQNPNGRSVPQDLVESFNAIDPKDTVASEYQTQDWVDWTLSEGGGMGITGLDELPEGIDREEVINKIQEIHREIREEKRSGKWNA